MPVGEPVGTFGDQHGPGLGERLQALRQIRRLADDRLLLRGAFAGQIAHDHHAGRDADANLQLGADIGPKVGHGVDQREPCARRLLGIILMRLGIAEIGKHAVPHEAGNDALVAADHLRDAGVISLHDLAQVLGIETRRKRRRAHQIAEHHRQLASLGFVSRSRF